MDERGAQTNSCLLWRSKGGWGPSSRGPSNQSRTPARSGAIFFFTRCDSYEVLQLAKRHSPFPPPPPPSPLRPHFHTLGFLSTFSLIVTITF